MSATGNTSSRLRREAEHTQYALRSSFFYRVHSVWEALLHLLTQYSGRRLNWRQRRQWGISEAAWMRLRQKRLPPAEVFCHPALLATEPRLIAYYRCLALLSQKGVQRLAVGTQNLEEGKGSLNEERASRIAEVLNGLISLLIESDPDWDLEGARIAALMNLGAQVNGSWRNAVGNEGARRVKELLVGYLQQLDVVKAVVLSDGSRSSPPSPPPSIEDIRMLEVNSGYRVFFGSEPDVSLRDPREVLIATIEVKYGLDPAGALERYGAAMRSFQAATRENARVVNVYLASCFTPELRRRMNADRLVNQDFNLLEVLGNTTKRRQFLEYVRRLLDL